MNKFQKVFSQSKVRIPFASYFKKVLKSDNSRKNGDFECLIFDA